MIEIKLQQGPNTITPMLARVRRELAQYPRDAEDEFRQLTPIARVNGGNARRRTQLKNNSEIVADYPYAQRLDEGWSKQAPRGMTEPFLKWSQRRIKEIFRKTP